MLCYPSSPIPIIDQSVIYQQYHHPVGTKFENRTLPYSLYQISMDSSSPSSEFDDPHISEAHLTPPEPRHHHPPLTTAPVNQTASVRQLQDKLDYLQDEWAAIDIGLSSLRTAFPAQPCKQPSKEHQENVDRELSIAYDDLVTQVRSLNRNLNRLDNKIRATRSSGSTS